ncbi:polysaccharide biosynthesis protein [Enterovibrio sp. ZSDZ35]|uniref:Polysaccharide biosynthesis protein n=1 Tax=Enterovibrio qingdaonensis TaxID=2899818 RepID=A0ABT5QNA0_9GAMM|nr:nucleoside-diphosphate sugar epimerase/dehydratase [Enterovibrio sp. ZSDZ35]MDD1782470.1 polysaccharide biosynthesis protein [Enterovibrio sp. ZSDZ35]
MINPIGTLLGAERHNKRMFTMFYDALAISFSLYAAFALRMDTLYPPIGAQEIASFAVTTVVTLLIFIRFGLYRAVLRYILVPALGNIFFAVFASAVVLALSSFILQSFLPRSVPFIYAGVAILSLGGPRILIRTIYYHLMKRKKPNVLIYGAGSTGRDLAFALQQGSDYHPVAFIDDDLAKKSNIMLGLKVYSYDDFDKLKGLYKPVKLLLAINNIDGNKRLTLVDKLAELPIKVQSVPSMEDLATGKASIEQVRDLDIAELLGREQVAPIGSLLSRCISDKSVMVTGAGGSIGSELCRQILKQKPHTLVLFELNEYNLYQIERELCQLKATVSPDTQIIAALGSVQRQNRLEKMMSAFNVETIYHAAAYKHVPIVEQNIVEGIRNNVFGTWYCAEAAVKCGVKDFVLISTDKAVRPTNVMGASKRLSELVLQALSDRESNTNFTMVRFGNVLGSSGSVVPLFREQIQAGGPVTVTHPNITRYFMLIPEAAELVIQAGALGNSGQVFVLDMGDPVKILDLAKRMINLMGYKERISPEDSLGSDYFDDEDIEIQFTGLRAGEKLYEELLIGDNVSGTEHPKILTALELKLHWDEIEPLLKELDVYCHDFEFHKIIQLLTLSPLGYTPEKSVKDLLHDGNLSRSAFHNTESETSRNNTN